MDSRDKIPRYDLDFQKNCSMSFRTHEVNSSTLTSARPGRIHHGVTISCLPTFASSSMLSVSELLEFLANGRALPP